MEIKRIGAQASSKGPADWFTGTVRSTRCSRRPIRRAHGRLRNLRARRTHRLAHPSARPDADRHGGLRLGPMLGRAGRGDPPGRCDLDWPGEKHWHGAKATTAMTHIAIQEALNGKVVDWMEKVGDDQYPSF